MTDDARPVAASTSSTPIAGGRPVLRPIPGWVVAVGVPVMLLVAVGAVWLLLGFGVDGTKLDVIRTGGALGVGLGGVLVLWLGIRGQRSTKLDLLAKYEAHELAERTAANTLAHQQQTAADARHDAAERRITGLYTKAADQLGSDKAAVRLAGLYALERLAQNTPGQREVIGNLLCAYLRMPFRPADGTLPAEADQDARDRNDARIQEQEARQTALDVLARHASVAGPAHWPELAVRLQRANLGGADLRSASLSGADLSGADLNGADLRGANLREVGLEQADLTRGEVALGKLRPGGSARGEVISGGPARGEAEPGAPGPG
nr:pentapeptide repeat-containing protein [Amycolatopsis orientalis]